MKSFILSIYIMLSVTFANASPNTISFLSIPSNASEFYSVFKRQPSQTELANVIELRDKFKNMENVYLIATASDIDKVVNKILKDWTDKGITSLPRVGFSIIGHNEKGEFFFPNGSHIKLEDIVPKLQGYPAMFLSCNAKTYLKDIPTATAVDFKLTYSEAMNISIDLDNIATNCSIYLKTPRKVAEEMIEKLNKQHNTTYRVKFLGATGALAASCVLLKELDEPEEIQKKKTDSTHIKHR